MKAPRAATLGVVERNLRRAAKKSRNVVFDSRRIKKIPDAAIERELSVQLKSVKKIDAVKFINRHAKLLILYEYLCYNVGIEVLERCGKYLPQGLLF